MRKRFGAISIALLFAPLMGGVAAMSANGSTLTPPLSGCAARARADFLDEAPGAERRVVPADCSVADANPVHFSWASSSAVAATSKWTLRVQDDAGKDLGTLTSQQPRAVWSKQLAPGRYQWQVSLDGDDQRFTSAWRRFDIQKGVTSTVSMPSADDLVALLRNREGSRLLPAGWTWGRATQALRAGALKPGLEAWIGLITAQTEGTAQRRPSSRGSFASAPGAVRADTLLRLMDQTNRDASELESLALAWRLTDQDLLLQRLKQHMLEVASWDPSGPTSEANQAQANRNAYLALAVAFDLAGDELGAEDRKLVVRAITVRLAAALRAQLILDRQPYQSFENTGIQTSLQALILLAGRAEFPDAADQLRRVWTLYLVQPQAWSLDDGANASSVAYAWFDLHHVVRTATFLRLAAGVDAMQLPQLRRIGDFLMAMTPITATALNAYGDGAEVNNLFQNYAPDEFRLYASLTMAPTHDWYWRQALPLNENNGRRLSPWQFLLSLTRASSVQPEAPKGRLDVFPDAGVAAFHDRPAAADRSTLVFRSSPYGSYNHGHADQNAFTYSLAGRSLLISSGYYPYYLSPHHAGVARATRYKNAVTFDGGIGQAEPGPNPVAPGAPVSSMDAAGKLLSVHEAPGQLQVTGDASAAYRAWDAKTARWIPLLTTAIRSIAFLPDAGVVVVFDWLESKQPRRWEWNYHGVEPFRADGLQLWASNGGQRACIDHWGTPGAVSLQAGFDIKPEKPLPDQYHARFTADRPSTAAVMVTTIRPNCLAAAPRVSVDQQLRSASVDVAGRTIRFHRQFIE